MTPDPQTCRKDVEKRARAVAGWIASTGMPWRGTRNRVPIILNEGQDP